MYTLQHVAKIFVLLLLLNGMLIIVGYAQPKHFVTQYLFIFLGRERHCESEMSSQEHDLATPANVSLYYRAVFNLSIHSSQSQ